MNISKLLNILKDIEIEENDYKINNKLEELVNFIKQNNVEESDKKKKELYDALDSSIFNSYTKSNILILDKINGLRFLANNAVKFLEGIFSSENFKLVERLEDFRKNRIDFIKKVSSSIKDLEDFGFSPHLYTEDNEYEIGLVLPEDNNLRELYESLGIWNKFLNVISEIVGETRENNKLSLLNDGSWEIFVLKSGVVAKVLDVILNKIADLYIKIQKIKENKEQLNFLKNKTIEQELKNEEKKIYNDFLEEVLNEVIKQYKGDSGRKNELKIELGNIMRLILKLTESGANMEIIVPEIEKPEEPQDKNEETNKEFEKLNAGYNEKMKEINKIILNNRKILSLGNISSGKPLLSSGLLSEDGDLEGISDNRDIKNS